MGEDGDNEEESTDEVEYLNKKQKSRQITVTNYYGTKKLEKGRIDELDRVITKAFIMANIPFNIIENPWFVNMIRTLQPGYNTPSRQVLSGTLLEAELSRINMRINNELDKESNFTISKVYILIKILFNVFIE